MAVRSELKAPSRIRRGTVGSSRIDTSSSRLSQQNRRTSDNDVPPPKLDLHELQPTNSLIPPPRRRTSSGTSTTESKQRRTSGNATSTKGNSTPRTPQHRQSGIPSIGRPNSHVRPRSRTNSNSNESKPNVSVQQRNQEESLKTLSIPKEAKQSNLLDQLADPASNSPHVDSNCTIDQTTDLSTPSLAFVPSPFDFNAALEAVESMDAHNIGSPPSAKRPKWLKNAPKTPIGHSNYEPNEDGGLSASQRVRLSLAGYSTSASLAPGSRETSVGKATAGTSHSTTSPAVSVSDASIHPSPAPVFEINHEADTDTPTSCPASVQSASAILDSERQRQRDHTHMIASKLAPTRNMVNMLMGYVRELKRSESELKSQVETIKGQKEMVLTESMVRVQQLEQSIADVERQREQERQVVDEQRQMIELLAAQITQLQQSVHAIEQHTSPQKEMNVPTLSQQETPLASYQSNVSYEDSIPPAPVTMTQPQSQVSDTHGLVLSPINRQVQRLQENREPLSPIVQGRAIWNTTPSGDHALSPSQLPTPPMFLIAPTDSDLPAPLTHSSLEPLGSADEGECYLKAVSPDSQRRESIYLKKRKAAENPHPETTDLSSSVLLFTSGPPPKSFHEQGHEYPSMTQQGLVAPTGSASPQRAFMPAQTNIEVTAPLPMEPIELTTPLDCNPSPPIILPSPQSSTPFHPHEEQTENPQSAIEQSPSEHVNGDTGLPLLSVVNEPPAHDSQPSPVQSFKPFLPLQRNSIVQLPSSSTAVIVLDHLLKDFFRAHDVNKLRMAEVYAKRYKGREDKLFGELTKRYGRDKVSELQAKFEQSAKETPSVNEPSIPSPMTPVSTNHAESKSENSPTSTLSIPANNPPIIAQKVSPTRRVYAPVFAPSSLPSEELDRAEAPPLNPPIGLTPLNTVDQAPSPSLRHPSALFPKSSPGRVSPQNHARPSFAKPSPSPSKPITLESLLNEFYRKHQPDKQRNVPALVREYSGGRERVLITNLKAKYGALSVKRLEENVEVLEKQGVQHQQKRVTKQPRGCLRRFIGWIIGWIVFCCLMVIVVTGTVITINHNVCMKNIFDDVLDDEACRGLQWELNHFHLERIQGYIAEEHSQSCFCSTWRHYDIAMQTSPSLDTAIKGIKLVAFSRPVIEPIVVDHVPNLPYTEYYQIYGKPVVQVAKTTLELMHQESVLLYERILVQLDETFTSLSHDNEQDDSIAQPIRDVESVQTMDEAMDDALTNVAKASKSLVENHSLLNPSEDSEAISQEVESDRNPPVIEIDNHDISVVEVVVAQDGLQGSEVISHYLESTKTTALEIKSGEDDVSMVGDVLERNNRVETEVRDENVVPQNLAQVDPMTEVHNDSDSDWNKRIEPQETFGDIDGGANKRTGVQEPLPEVIESEAPNNVEQEPKVESFVSSGDVKEVVFHDAVVLPAIDESVTVSDDVLEQSSHIEVPPTPDSPQDRVEQQIVKVVESILEVELEEKVEERSALTFNEASAPTSPKTVRTKDKVTDQSIELEQLHAEFEARLQEMIGQTKKGSTIDSDLSTTDITLPIADGALVEPMDKHLVQESREMSISHEATTDPSEKSTAPHTHTVVEAPIQERIDQNSHPSDLENNMVHDTSTSDDEDDIFDDPSGLDPYELLELADQAAAEMRGSE